MTDSAHRAAEARRRQYQAEFYLVGCQERREAIHPDDELWCTDDGGAPCARCAPLVERHDAYRATLPRWLVWVEDATESVLYWCWKLRIRLGRKAR